MKSHFKIKTNVRTNGGFGQSNKLWFFPQAPTRVRSQLCANELLALGGDANKIPYFYDGEQLIEGNDAVMEHLRTLA